MKKRTLSLILTLVMCLALLPTVCLADGTVGQSLDAPLPLPDHLQGSTDPDTPFILDFDTEKVDTVESLWGDEACAVPEGTVVTVYQNPDFEGTISWVNISGNDINESYGDGFSGSFYSCPDNESAAPSAWRYMSPVTISLTHNAATPDGTSADLAQMGLEYDLSVGVCWAYDEETTAISEFHDFIYVIPDTAYASTQTVTIDGKATEFQMYAIKDANGNDTNYVKVRDVALALDGTAAQFNVGWDGNVNLEPGQPYTTRNGQENNTPYSGNQPIQAATSATNVNGSKANLTAFVITDSQGNGSTYYKLRDLGKALGFTVDWSAEKGVYIETAPADGGNLNLSENAVLPTPGPEGLTVEEYFEEVGVAENVPGAGEPKKWDYAPEEHESEYTGQDADELYEQLIKEGY